MQKPSLFEIIVSLFYYTFHMQRQSQGTIHCRHGNFSDIFNLFLLFIVVQKNLINEHTLHVSLGCYWLHNGLYRNLVFVQSI